MARIATVLTLLALVMMPTIVARRASNTARHDTKAHEQEQDLEKLVETQSLPVEVFQALKTHFKRPPPLPRPAGRIVPSGLRPYIRPQTEPQPPRTPVPSPPTHIDTPEVLARKEPGLNPVPEVPLNTRPYEMPPNSPPYVHAVADGNQKQKPQPPHTPYIAQPEYPPPKAPNAEKPSPASTAERIPPWSQYHTAEGHVARPTWIDTVWPKPKQEPQVPPNTLYADHAPLLAVGDGGLKQEPNTPYPPPFTYPPSAALAFADGNPKQEPQPPHTPYIVVPPYPPNAALNAEKPKPAPNPEKPSWTPPWWWHDPHRPPSMRPYPKGDKQDKSTAGATLAGAALFAAQGSTPAPEEADADQPHASEDGSQSTVIASPDEAWKPWNWIGGLLGPTVPQDEADDAKVDDEVSTSSDETEDPHDEDAPAEDMFHRIDETEDWNPGMSQDDSDDSSASAPSHSSADEEQVQEHESEEESEEDLSDMFYRTDETLDW